MNESTPCEQFAVTALDYLQRLPRAACPDSATSVLPRAVFKSTPEDFQVDEILPFVADGEGHHLLLQIRKEYLNTADVQQALSALAGCRQSDVGFSGLKDFHAVTTQWFSLPLTTGGDSIERANRDMKEGRDIECQKWLGELLQTRISGRAGSVEIVSMARHQRKLRRGTHRRNRFKTILRGCNDRKNFEQRLKFIEHSGFPNYFGLQRFGRGASNLKSFYKRWGSADLGALANNADYRGWQAKGGRVRQSQQMAVSAMRSLVFNLYCRSRVREGSWLVAGAQEPLLLGDGNSFFLNDSGDPTVAERVASGQLATSGPLFGQIGASEPDLASQLGKERDDVLYSLDANCPLSLTLGNLLGQPDSSSNTGCIFSVLGLQHRRRALRRFVYDLNWRWLDDESALELRFELSTGTYATALFQQLGELTDGSG